MKIRSEVTGIEYEAENAVYFRNLHQSAFYIEHNAKIIDIFTDGSNKLVFVFDRQEHNELIKLWMTNKENTNG